MNVIWMLAEASLRSAPLLLFVLVATQLFARRTPGLRHLALVGALFATLAMPQISLVTPDWFIPLWEIGGEASAPATIFSAGAAAGLVQRGGISPILALAALWAAGTVVLLARLALGLIGVCRQLRSARSRGSRKVPGHRTRIVYSERVRAPMAAGLFHPMVLMPVAVLSWSGERRRAVLAHEFAHCRRGDSWSRLVAALVVALHWPNPLVWMVARRARTAAEEAADQAVLGRGSRAEDYADLLLDLSRSAGPASLASSFSGGLRGSLQNRVQTLLRRPRASRPREAAAVAVTLVILSAAGGGASPRHVDTRVAGFATRYGVGPELAGMILTAAERERIPHALAFGLVRVESDFDPNRVSPRGAVGYTQILPSTAAVLEPGLKPARLHDPELNLRLGFRLLRDYMNRFPGDTERALLAYLEGPAAAQRAHYTSDPDGYPARVLRAAAPAP